VELDELEVRAGDAGGAIDDDFDCRAEVLELDFLLGDVERGLLGHYSHGVILTLC
jgi:hypothetical protein